MKILHIDASPRYSRSHTRKLTQDFIKLWQEKDPAATVIYRDLGKALPSFINENWIAAAFTAANQRTPEQQQQLNESDSLVEEFMTADMLVMGVPMYNFGVPAVLKAWIDQIVRVGRTFLFEPDDPQPYKPLLTDKPTIIMVATGDSGYEPDGPYASLNQVEPYLRTVLPFIGINQLHFVYAGNDEFGGERLAESLLQAEQQIQQLVDGSLLR